MTSADELFRLYAEAYEAGEDPAAGDYVEKADGPDRLALELMIDNYLLKEAPIPQVTEEDVSRERSSARGQQIAQAISEPSIADLRRLRESQELELEELADRVLAAGQVEEPSPQERDKTADYLGRLERGELGLWWVAATNPLVSMPSLDRVKAAAARCPLVVLSEAYAGTETAAVAHLLLPAAQWSEKSGVMTNSERRVSLCPAFRPAPGEARADWAIYAELGRRLGFQRQFSYGSAAEVHAEFRAITAGRVCDLSGLSHALLAEHGPQQWPFPAGTVPGGGQARLYEPTRPFPAAPAGHRFPTASGRARLLAEPPLGLAEPPCDTYPLVLTVGRYLGHWHTMTRTAHVARLVKQHPEPLLELHAADAERYGLGDGELAELCSRRGSLRARVQLSERIRPGTVFLPMHWGASQANACEVNRLMHEQACPQSKQPELKAAAVALRPWRPAPQST